MSKAQVLVACLATASLCLAFSSRTAARSIVATHPDKSPIQVATASPALCITDHNVGRLALAVSNFGTFGTGFDMGLNTDCITGGTLVSGEFPKGSRTQYVFSSAFWIGAIVGHDTLVSVGADGWQLNSGELFPDEAPFGNMIARSIIDPTRPEFEDATSEQDRIAVYTDTFTCCVPGLPQDEVDHRPHRPLYVEVTQRSYAWSYPYAEDFVLFDYSIKNIGKQRLNSVYLGVYVDADVQMEGAQEGYDDDICGFLDSADTHYGDCDWRDEVNIAWIADNDGQLRTANGPYLPNVTGTRIVRTPSDSLDISFNWWVSNTDTRYDFGPQRRGHVRDLGHGGMGTPSGDRNKYAFLRNREFDYDQIFTAAISPTDPDWEYPNQQVSTDISDGYDTRYLLSFGPFSIDPNQTLPLSFAYVAGESFHTYRDNAFRNLQTGSYHPQTFYDSLHFEDLALNAMWAAWIYDNPGVDSDNDGFRGEFRFCCSQGECDTVWYKGDSVPDFRGASPPPAPTLWAEPEVGRVYLRWNGLRTETARDVFSRQQDFEGYRVYFSRDSRETSYSLLASYDIEDYNKWVWDQGREQWRLKDDPYTLEELRCLYGQSCDDAAFDPLGYSRSNPLLLSGSFYENGHLVTWDSAMFFTTQDFNRSIPGVTTDIRKRFPDQPYPSSLNTDSVEESELTADGYLKYFEYEYVIDNLLPTVSYYVNVTAFDYGSPSSGLASLETSKTVAARLLYPQETAQTVEARDLKAYVYPNPYRGDANYAAKGFEGRDDLYKIPDRIRRVHFANLPARCTITIFTLDGDMVRQIEHNVDPTDPLASHEEWDLITRNTQSVVSGIYYWTVEAPDAETQIGKLVIIL